MSQAPEAIITKSRNNVAVWNIWHKDLGDNWAIETFAGAAAAGSTGKYISNVGASTYKTGNDISLNQNNTYTYVAYCFHSIDGYSKMGSFTGNASTDGPFVHCGFRPAWVLIKNTVDVAHAVVYDVKRGQYNVVDTALYPSTSDADQIGSSVYIDILSNGFKMRTSHNSFNGGSDKFIYMAFAEYPFKYSNARGSSYDKYVAPDTTYELSQSLRFEDGSGYLSKTFSSSGGNDWTYSVWAKIGNTGSYKVLLASSSTSNPYYQSVLAFQGDDKLAYYQFSNESSRYVDIQSTALFRDPSSWYHIVCKHDGTSNLITLYVNGVEVASGTPSSTYQYINKTTYPHYIGNYTYQSNPGGAYDGYMSDVYFIDGQALGPEHFGYRDATYGDWRPQAYSDGNPAPDYGSNGFHLEFASGAIGTDSSPMGNDWTANNLSATTDVVQDNPSNNFATWNPILGTSTTLTEGNLKTYISGTSAVACGNIPMTSGKWYAEVYCFSGSYPRIGIFDVDADSTPNDLGGTSAGWCVLNSPSRKFHNGSSSSYGSFNLAAGDIVGIAYDADNGKVWFSNNGTWVGTVGTSGEAYNGISGAIAWACGDGYDGSTQILNSGQDSSFAGNKTAQGNTDSNGIGDFYYTPPTGFLALCTANLSDPAVVPGENFNTVLWAGDNASSRTITNSFESDFVWIKARNTARNHVLFDSIRTFAADKELISNGTSAEGANQTSLYGYVSDTNASGIVVSAGTSGKEYVNESGISYVAWNWKADNTSGSSNTDGSITSTVAANVDAGFSIVSYTGTGSAASVGHGLSQAPELVIFKNRTSAGLWPVKTTLIANDEYLILDQTVGKIVNASTTWSVDSSVMNISTNSNYNTASNNHIAYAFHSVDGYSKFGSYTGNGSTDGPFVYTGFRPAFIMLKNASAAGAWLMYDAVRNTYNITDKSLAANYSTVEDTTYYLDSLSNGFKARGTWQAMNSSGHTFIYMAFAESPFKRSNAR